MGIGSWLTWRDLGRQVRLARHEQLPTELSRLAWLPLLAERGVELISAGFDEVPGVYKDIHAIMAAQTELVEASWPV